MRILINKRIIITCIAGILLANTAEAADINWAKKATVSASSHRGDYVPEKVKDGVVSDASRWLAADADQKPWVQLA